MRSTAGDEADLSYLQDAGYNVAAVIWDPEWTGQPAALQQFSYEPYGEVVLAEADANQPATPAVPVHRIGHQGLFFERFLTTAGDAAAAWFLDPNAVGVYLTRNRAYSPRLGRWLSRDMNESAQPVVAALAMNAQTLDLAFGAFSALGHYGDGMSLYAYAGSNPVNRRDPLGLFSVIEVQVTVGDWMYWESVEVQQKGIAGAFMAAALGAMLVDMQWGVGGMSAIGYSMFLDGTELLVQGQYAMAERLLVAASSMGLATFLTAHEAADLIDKAKNLIGRIVPGGRSAVAMAAQVEAIAQELIRAGFLAQALDILTDLQNELANASRDILEGGNNSSQKTEDLLRRLRDLIGWLSRQIKGSS